MTKCHYPNLDEIDLEQPESEAQQAEISRSIAARLRGTAKAGRVVGAHTTPEEEQVRMSICRQVLVKYHELRGNPAAFLSWLEGEAFSQVPWGSNAKRS